RKFPSSVVAPKPPRAIEHQFVAPCRAAVVKPEAAASAPHEFVVRPNVAAADLPSRLEVAVLEILTHNDVRVRFGSSRTECLCGRWCAPSNASARQMRRQQ